MGRAGIEPATHGFSVVSHRRRVSGDKSRNQANNDTYSTSTCCPKLRLICANRLTFPQQTAAFIREFIRGASLVAMASGPAFFLDALRITLRANRLSQGVLPFGAQEVPA